VHVDASLGESAQFPREGGTMKKVLVSLLVALLVLPTPGVAQAWELVDEGRGWGAARASGWTRNYEIVRFYAGHPKGTTGTFGVSWTVVCRGGFAGLGAGDRVFEAAATD
jgi:hypothetical protein